MRVLLAPSAYYPNVGGIEELTRQLALTLAKRGHRTSVLTNRWPASTQRDERIDGVDVERLDFPLPSFRPGAAARFVATSVPAAVALVRTLRRQRPDVIHVIGAGPQSAYLATLAPLVSARLVFTAQGELTFDAHDVFARSLSLRHGLRTMLARADVVTACSGYVLRDLEVADAVVIPNGVDPDEFGSPQPGTGLLALGRLVRQKGFDVLLAAAADERLASVHVTIAGDGPERGALERQAHGLGLADRVTFAGAASRARIAQLFRDAAVFALPSRGEPFGIALLEAMAAGVPAVATASGGVPEFAQDDENALLVPPDDARALADAIVRIVGDEPLSSRLAANGLKTAEKFSWDRIAERYERVYG